MARRHLAVSAATLVAVALGMRSAPAAAQDVGPLGPPLGVKAALVRSVTVETTGAVTGKFIGSATDPKTGLMGTCNPKTFANFMLTMAGGKGAEIWATLWSRGPIPTGETGIFRLSRLQITFRQESPTDFIQREFDGPGTLTLTRHDAAPGARRMVGTLEGKALQGRDADAGQALDARVSFDLSFSCGIR